MRIFLPSFSCNKTEVRSRLLAGFGELQTRQLHPIIGTPVLVPDPKRSTCSFHYHKGSYADFVLSLCVAFNAGLLKRPESTFSVPA